MNIKQAIAKRFPGIVNLIRFNVYHHHVLDSLDPAAYWDAVGAWRTLIEDYGFGRSSKGACVDHDGNPIPWYSYPATEFLGKLSFANRSVFEYGSGNSTLWWAGRAQSVTSVEDNSEWFAYMRPRLPTNSNVILADDPNRTDYVRAIRGRGEFDVIIVDGPVENGCRTRCCEEAVVAMKPDGMILIDNSNRVPMACAVLQKAGFTQIDFAGFLPLSPYTNCTSLFFKGAFCFGRLPAPLRIVGGPKEAWEPWSEFKGPQAVAPPPSPGVPRWAARCRRAERC
jgi:hypothetical protein